MHDDILKKLAQRVDRRSFLRGSSLAAAAVIGVAAFPVLTSAQNAQQQGAAAQKPAGDKPADQATAKTDDKKDDKKDEKSDKKEEASAKKEEKAEEDPFKVTKKDEQGRDYRVCPQCGYNMYKQDRTWTCENCGFSYTE